MNVVGVSGRSTNPKPKIAAVAAVAPNAWPRSAGLGRLNADRPSSWCSASQPPMSSPATPIVAMAATARVVRPRASSSVSSGINSSPRAVRSRE